MAIFRSECDITYRYGWRIIGRWKQNTAEGSIGGKNRHNEGEILLKEKRQVVTESGTYEMLRKWVNE